MPRALLFLVLLMACCGGARDPRVEDRAPNAAIVPSSPAPSAAIHDAGDAGDVMNAASVSASAPVDKAPEPPPPTCESSVRFCGETFAAGTKVAHCPSHRAHTVEDLAPISCLRRVEEVTIESNDPDHPLKIRDLRPLEGLPELSTLYLRKAAIRDLGPLARSGKLKHVSIADAELTDLRPLAGLSRLEGLALWGNPTLSGLGPLAGLTRLKTLHLGWTNVSDLSPLAGLTHLEELWLWQTSVRDIAPLRGLVELRRLFLNDTKVADLSPLAGMSKLSWLDISGTAVTDLGPIMGLSSLVELRLPRTKITWAQIGALQRANPKLRVIKSP